MQDDFQTPAVNAEETVTRVTECIAGVPLRRGRGSERPQDRTRTWSVSVVIRTGQAASVFHRKVTTHSQMRENMGWVF